MNTTNPKLEDKFAEAVTQGMIAMQVSMTDGKPGRHEKVVDDFKQTILSDLLAAIPDERVGTEKIPLDSTERGYNIAIQDAKAAIRSYVGVES